MTASYFKIWLHVMLSTKEKHPLITSKIEKPLFAYLKNQLNESGCVVKIINGMSDHVHLLFQQSPDKSAAEIIKKIKEASTHWINHDLVGQGIDIGLNDTTFAWQIGYTAFSVSESQIEKVHQYILNQKEQHKKLTYADELEEFIKLHNIARE